MSTLIAQLGARLESLQQQYHLHFAGQPRVTRNPEMMEAMLESARVIRAELVDLGASDLKASTLALAEERVELYTTERRAVREARTQVGDKGVEASWLGQRANHLFHRYRRHFAGRSRTTRDLALLAEMTRDLRAIAAEMATLGSGWRSQQLDHDVTVVNQYLSLYDGEQGEIKSARDAHGPDEAESVLAQLANAQFEVYRLHFAGQPRLSRRPELLDRMIASLQTVLARMEALPAQGHHSEGNQQNIAIVRGRLGEWQVELDAIRSLRAQTPLLQVVEALGQAAETVLELYNQRFAGQDRVSRDVDLLVSLCDRLWDLSRQMEGIAGVHPIAGNERNLEMVYDLLNMMENEHDEIVRVKESTEGS
jgi:hypothetical protein